MATLDQSSLNEVYVAHDQLLDDRDILRCYTQVFNTSARLNAKPSSRTFRQDHGQGSSWDITLTLE